MSRLRAVVSTTVAIVAATAGPGTFRQGVPEPPDPPTDPGSWPQPRLWRAAGRALLAKLIAEFSYEELLRPEPAADTTNPADTANSADLPSVAPTVARVGRGEPSNYRLTCGEVAYTFTARRGTFGTWWLDASSLRREGEPSRTGDRPAPADDPVRFVLDAADLLGWPDDVTADVVRELTATHAADVRLLAGARSATSLADAAYTELEGFATGHPCMVANKGRLGFGLADVDRYAPEARNPLRLLWVAVHPDLATFTAAGFTTAGPSGPSGGSAAGPSGGRDPDTPGDGVLTSQRLLAAELDTFTQVAFAATLATRLAFTDADAADIYPGTGSDTGTGMDHNSDGDQVGGPNTASTQPSLPARDYVWLPVHPWQWEHVIAPLFAAEIATGRLILLGEAPDRYLPLQSVRTLVNIDRPSQLNVKLALMIRNTLVWRGMSADDAHAGPDTSAWLVGIRDADAFLRDVTRVLPLPEVAGVTVTHGAYESLARAPYRLHELLGALWRQPVEALISPGERARTFASLLLVGSEGRALVSELVARSGQTPREWLRALLSCLLPPLLHYLYVYGVAFTPHGENVIVVFDGGDVPTRIALKDFGADVELVDVAHSDTARTGAEPPDAESADAESAGIDRPGRPEHADPPEAVGRYLRRWPASDLAHSILSALCTGHFRFFSVLVEDHLGVREKEFWTLVRAEIENYHRGFPEYADRFVLFNLLAPTFDRVCLNREQLAGTGFHDRPDRDGGFDIMYGQVANPLHLVTTDTETPDTATLEAETMETETMDMNLSAETADTQATGAGAPAQAHETTLPA
ncbi:IucA/IucC family protein [Protofrankia symbiont of Coriaria ruscifolia]|nr:IucA/IucC family protein [Protofrankia symbiont of Coriaria ruscifolia]